MNKHQAKQLHEDVDNAMQKIFDKHGLVYIPGNLRYSVMGMRMSFTGTSKDVPGVKSAQITLDQLQRGLAPALTTAYYTNKGKSYKCTVLKAARSRYHCKCNDTGIQFTIPFMGLRLTK